MEVETVGNGEPEYAIIGLTHGDEPCGKEAINRFKESEFETNKAVKLILANEKAYKEDVRFLDSDLNRVFPGDLNSENHEERLAARIMSEVEDLKVLDLHSTKSYRNIFSAQSKLDKDRFDLVKSTGVDKVSFQSENNGCLNEYAQCVVVECGFQHSQKAAENAYQVLLNFLAAENVIDCIFELSEPEIFRVFETVEKPRYEFTAENFKIVEEGEIYANKQDIVLAAEESFYPVLMSTNGYENILGYKAEKVRKEEIF